MRNYRELSQQELDEIAALYPTTANHVLSKRYDISVDAIRDNIAIPRGLRKTTDSRGLSEGRCELTDDGKRWIIKHFKHTKNADIMERFNISDGRLHRFAREHGLKKSRQFMKKMQCQAKEAAMDACEEYGIYEERAESTRRQWEEWRKLPREQWPGYKQGLPPWKQKGVSRKRYEESLERKVRHRNETIVKERRRILFGLEQQTNLRLVKTMTRKMTVMKSRAVCTRGYIGYRQHPTWLLYDESTRRSEEVEQRAQAIGLKVKPIAEAYWLLDEQA